MFIPPSRHQIIMFQHGTTLANKVCRTLFSSSSRDRRGEEVHGEFLSKGDPRPIRTFSQILGWINHLHYHKLCDASKAATIVLNRIVPTTTFVTLSLSKYRIKPIYLPQPKSHSYPLPRRHATGAQVVSHQHNSSFEPIQRIPQGIYCLHVSPSGTSCATRRMSIFLGTGIFLHSKSFRCVDLPVPLGATSPYLLPCDIVREASFKSSLPRTDTEKESIFMSLTLASFPLFSRTEVFLLLIKTVKSSGLSSFEPSSLFAVSADLTLTLLSFFL
ncbi:unnamed protein product [Cochlearia groenlandica]